MQVMCSKSKEAKNQHYCRCKVGGTSELIHAAFASDQEVSSPLWVSKEVSKEIKLTISWKFSLPVTCQGNGL